MREVQAKEAITWWHRPERIVLAVTVDLNGQPNIIALGWKMRTSFDPLMLAISIGKTRHSHQLISNCREFVLAVPGADLSEQVLFIGTHSGKNVDKFKTTHLTPLPAKHIRPPLIQECLVNHECKVVGQLDTGDHTIFVGEVLTSWAADTKQPVLCSIGTEAGYQCTHEGFGFRLGVVRN
jgi:flavin reductase (DIM6/NTAB) family NADH-FMN oxidoreductase RutF